MHLTTSAADFSKETLVVKEEETYDAGAFEKVEAEVVKLLQGRFSRARPPQEVGDYACVRERDLQAALELQGENPR